MNDNELRSAQHPPPAMLVKLRTANGQPAGNKSDSSSFNLPQGSDNAGLAFPRGMEMDIMTSKESVKTRAHDLKSVLAQLGHDISLGHALETVSRLAGARDWNTYCSELEQSPGLDDWLKEHAAAAGTTCRVKLQEGLLQASVRFGATTRARRTFGAMLTTAQLFLTLQRAVQGAGQPLFYYEGATVWRLEPNKAPVEVFSHKGARACFYLAKQNLNGHWTPSIVVEDEAGHYPTDWDYGADMKHAQHVVDKLNEDRGVSEEEVSDIVCTSMVASRRSPLDAFRSEN